MRTLHAWWLCAALGAVLAAPVAHAQDEDDDESEAPEESGPDATPTEETPTQATTAPTAEQTQTPTATEEEVAAPAATPEQLPWRNSFFGWTNGLTLNSLAPGAQLSYD